MRTLRFRSSCQYTHGCCAPASWAARHTTVRLDSVTTLLEFLTALLEYVDLINGIVQSADFPTVKAL